MNDGVSNSVIPIGLTHFHTVNRFDESFRISLNFSAQLYAEAFSRA